MPSDSVSSAMPAARICSNTAAARRNSVALRLEIRRRLRDRHQPAQPQPWQRRHGARQRQRLLGRHARLVGAAVHVDLQADLQRRQVRPAAARDSRSAIFSRSMLCTQSKCSATTPRLVALQRADAVPFELARADRPAPRSWPRLPARSSRRRRAGRPRGPRAPPRPGRSWTLPAGARSPDRARPPCRPSRSAPELAGACRQSSS